MKVMIYQTFTAHKFPKNITALLIKIFQDTNYSHYVMSYEDGEKTVYVDSTGTGVRSMTEEYFMKHHNIMQVFICRKDIPKEYFITWFKKHEGKGYGFTQLIGLALKTFKIVRFNPFGKGAKRIICNELVILFLNRFYATKIEDTDSLDLNDTEELIKKVNI